jgi:folate-dependent tRNA-U54 methylase TrmFO/GidA
MEGSQWALYNIDRDKFEKNITKPEVVEGIKDTKKIEISQESIDEYPTSDSPVGEGIALGYLTEPDVIKTRSGRKKTVAGTGQMTFVELGEKAN